MSCEQAGRRRSTVRKLRVTLSMKNTLALGRLKSSRIFIWRDEAKDQGGKKEGKTAKALGWTVDQGLGGEGGSQCLRRLLGGCFPDSF